MNSCILVSEKSNEITVVLGLLDQLDLADCIVTPTCRTTRRHSLKEIFEADTVAHCDYYDFAEGDYVSPLMFTELYTPWVTFCRE